MLTELRSALASGVPVTVTTITGIVHTAAVRTITSFSATLDDGTELLLSAIRTVRIHWKTRP